MSRHRASGQPDQKRTSYVEGRFFVDKADFLNIKISPEALQHVTNGGEVTVRKHINYILKIPGLPFESVASDKQGNMKCLFDA